MEQINLLGLRNLPLKRFVANALGKIELLGYSKRSWSRLCNSSEDIPRLSGPNRVHQNRADIMLSPPTRLP